MIVHFRWCLKWVSQSLASVKSPTKNSHVCKILIRRSTLAIMCLFNLLSSLLNRSLWEHQVSKKPTMLDNRCFGTNYRLKWGSILHLVAMPHSKEWALRRSSLTNTWSLLHMKIPLNGIHPTINLTPYRFVVNSSRFKLGLAWFKVLKAEDGFKGAQQKMFV